MTTLSAVVLTFYRPTPGATEFTVGLVDTKFGRKPYVLKFVSLLAVGRWFPPGTPASSTSETDISSS